MNTFNHLFLVLLISAFGTSKNIPLKTPDISKNLISLSFAHQNILFTAPLKSEHTPEDSHSSQNKTEMSSESSSESDYQEYSYEVELDSSEDFIRQHLCPDDDAKGNRRPYLYDLEAKACSMAGERGHCGKNMVFRPDVNSTIFGYCECNFGKTRLPLVYHNETNMCHYIYTQAYCLKNQWLILDKRNNPVCEESLCQNNKNIKTMNVPLNGTGPCVKLNSPSTHCSNEEIVQFGPNRTIPTCIVPSKRPTPRLLSPITQTNCPPGSFHSLSGKCQSSWSW